MNKIAGFLFSARLMAVILAVFATSIAIATFIENDFGSPAARAIVYNAHWFEFLLLLGTVNLTGRIIVKKLYTRNTISIFLFHIAFIIILAGAAITRYTGSEGTMTIREGSASNVVLSDKTYLQVVADKVSQFKVSFNLFGRNRFQKEIIHQGKPFKIKTVKFVSNAYETIEPVINGIPVAEFIYADSSVRRSLVIPQGDKRTAGDIELNFSDLMDSLNVNLVVSGDSIGFITSLPVSISSMGGESFKILEPGVTHMFIPRLIYSFGDQMVVLNQFYPSGKTAARQVPYDQGQTFDAVIVELTGDDFTREVFLPGKPGHTGLSRSINLNGKDLVLSYGSINKELPFKLKLNDFIIERYPGSHSPSSFESRVELTDSARNISGSYRIYMNNILKYRGYRFYQSSYDADEKGTILSVNNDQAGTLVSYTGYALLGFCMLLSLFSRKSRFRSLSIESNKIKHLRDAIYISSLIFLFQSTGVCAQDDNKGIVTPDAKHASLFGRLLVQDNSGRIEPVNTLSSEVLRKLTRSDIYEGMNSDQVFLGMITEPSTWQHEPLIKATHPTILDLLNTNNKYHSFSSFFRNQTYILQDHVSRAFRKKPALRSKFDNEIIKLDEKVNICYLILSGELLRIFPVPGDSTQTWYNPQAIINKLQTEDSSLVNSAILNYAQSVRNAMVTGDWRTSEEVLRNISEYQQRISGDICPGDRKISAEIFLNKSDIFSRISKFYGIIGFLLLVLHFGALFFHRLKLKTPLVIGLILIVVLFCIHTAGLGLRWYVSGHAPWSNGYEALIYVAWAAVLAGIAFSSKSSLTLSIGSILSFLTLFVAHLSWMDPQITNLVPVLKSYWLILHVATITASYGFLAMGALLAFVNLLTMFLHTGDNRLYIKYTILEITNTIEMALTLGLYLLTIGVFLGAVWANESWGRYWGWDPKETWALVTVIVYAFILHMRMVPGLRSIYSFNLGSLLAFSSVIMTYFGVNYYLSGLHSYAQGDPLPVPAFVYYTLAVIIITAIIARKRSVKLALDEYDVVATKAPR